MPPFVTIDAVADAAFGAGFRGEALAIAVAVTKPESGGGAPAGYWADAGAVGDVRLANATWGPSLGAWQVRTLRAETGKGTTRDANLLQNNLGAQAQAAYAIAGGNATTGSWGRGGNRNWGHWSVFQQGKHRAYLDEARAAGQRREAGGGSGSIGGGGSSSWGRRRYRGPSGSSGAGGSAGSGSAGGDPVGGGGELSPDVVIPGGSLPVAYVAPRRIIDLRVTGPAERWTAGGLVLGGEVELTRDEASQLTLNLLNPGYVFAGSGRGTAGLRSTVDWRGLRFVVSAEELEPDGPEPRVTLECRDWQVDLLKRTNVDAGGRAVAGVEPGKPTAGKNLSPTEYAALQASAVPGLRFMGEGSPRRTDIAPQRGDDGVYESPWEVINRLADELGFIAYVARGVLYFGRPKWLTARATEVKVGTRPNGWGDPSLDVIAPVHWRDTVDDFHGADLTVTLPRWRGEQVRPGMKLLTKGLTGLGHAEWLVDRVAWPIDDGQGPVTVDAVAAVDPIVHSKEGPKPAGAEGGAPGGAGGGGAPSAHGFVWPAVGRLSSGYRPANRPNHQGIDIAAPTGTPIIAAGAGTVSKSYVSASYGEVIYIDHGGGVETRYAHQSRRRAMAGARVERGERIGDVGSTGRSTGPHLHFEVRLGGSAVNPATMLPAAPK